VAQSDYEQVMTRENLREYMKWRKKPWPIGDGLYERLPMLAVRNYLSNADDAEDWPLCWTRGRNIRVGLSVCTEMLRIWGGLSNTPGRCCRSDTSELAGVRAAVG
jgi:hypothetical protein